MINNMKKRIFNKRLISVCNYSNTFKTNEKALVSVCIGTYNQKEYVSQCIDSVLSQLVNFKVEVLINDDASTDGTQELLLDYQSKYPQIIKVFINKENQFRKMKDYSVVYRVHAPRITGKYVALLDSDDYYCDNMALYSKVNVLERHKECNACFSRVRKINEKDNTAMHLMPKKQMCSGVISSNKLIKNFIHSYCFQTSSYFFRSNHYKEFCINYPLFAQKIKVFDEPVVMYFGALGRTYYINKVFSVYRKFSNNSWSNNKNAINAKQKIVNLNSRINYLGEFNKYTNLKYNKYCEWGINHSQITIYSIMGDFKKILDNKHLSKFYRKRYFKDYIRLKYLGNN